jgi:glycerophosphoryl diester phosphodiesterase
MQRIAHRGYSAIAPENTLAAFQAALAVQADGVELDVHLSADGVPVVIHDGVLTRTTDGEGDVNAFPLRQLQALDAGSWFSPAFAGQRLPTLRQAMELLCGRTIPYIELKSPDTASPVVALLQEMGMTGQVVIMSFYERLVQEIVQRAPGITVRLLLGADGDHPEDGWRTAARHAGVTRLSIDEQALTPERVRLLHAEGYEIIAWTVDDAARMAELRDMGIAGIISNEIGTLMDL